MKRTKKAAALMLALLIAMSMMLPAFAAGSISVFNGIKVATKDYDVTNGAENTTGTITISGVHVGDHDHATVYKVYKMLHLESFIAGGAGVEDAYSYLVVDEWYDFFKSDSVATQYVSFRNNDYVYWNGGETAEDLIDFSNAALEYAKANLIAPVMTSETPFNDPDNTIDPTKPHAETYPNQNETGYLLDTTAATGVFHGLSMGYYLIDSNVGSLCGLTTTNPAATVQAKNDHCHRNAGIDGDSHQGQQNPVTDQQLYHHRCATEQFNIAYANLIQNPGNQLILGHHSYHGDQRTDDDADEQSDHGDLHSCPQALQDIFISLKGDELLYKFIPHFYKTVHIFNQSKGLVLLLSLCSPFLF